VAPPARPAGAAPTLADVAHLAGVSTMAVSSALNGARTSARVSARTRERVLAAAQALGYRANATARALALRRTNAIGLLANFVGDKPNVYFLELFAGVMQGAACAGQSTTVFTLGDWGKEARQRIPALCDGRVDGMVLLGPRLHEDGSSWLPTHTPLVSVHANLRLSGVVNIDSDEEAGAFEMVRRLLMHGHRRILHMGGPEGLAGADKRIAGYLRAHEVMGVEPAPGHLVRSPEYSAAVAREVLNDWLDRHRGEPLPQAIFGANDAIALGCIDVLQARSLRVPADVSVVGFDDTLLARTTRLATVRQPLHAMGRRAVELLIERIESHRRGDASADASNIVFPTELVDGVTLAEARTLPIAIS
jgi:LacI family transcriptional regulator